MKVGVIGSGDVGQALGAGFAGRGDEVMIGSRDPKSDKLKNWVSEAGSRASSGTFAQAAAFGDFIVLATLWSGTKSALDLAGGAGALSGKTVMDVTNPLIFPEGKPPELALGHTDSGGEQVQRWLPSARVVKAFNSVGNAFMVHPQFPGGPPDMFFCGNDAEAKAVVAGICREWDWNPVDVGGIEGARMLEPLCILWVTIGMRSGSWNNAFKVLRK